MDRVKRERRNRTERRFIPTGGSNPAVFGTGGVVSALTLGAGVYGKFFSNTENAYASYLLAGGAALFGALIWFSTSGEVMLRVGDAGVAADRETLQRIPWHQIESVTWDGKRSAVVVTGKDEGQAATEIAASVRSHRIAAAWIVSEATRRIPKKVKLSNEERDAVGGTNPKDGETLALDALQVVGKKDPKSKKAIAYSKDARVCPMCERIYHRKSVPEKCACGADLTELASDTSADEEDDGSEAFAT